MKIRKNPKIIFIFIFPGLIYSTSNFFLNSWILFVCLFVFHSGISISKIQNLFFSIALLIQRTIQSPMWHAKRSVGSGK